MTLIYESGLLGYVMRSAYLGLSVSPTSACLPALLPACPPACAVVCLEHFTCSNQLGNSLLPVWWLRGSQLYWHEAPINASTVLSSR